MTYSLFDDLYDENEKVEEAWFAFPPNPVGLHVMATTVCNRRLTDGVVPARWLEQKLPNPKDRARILAAMVDGGLLDLLPAGETLAMERKRPHDPMTVGPFDQDRYVVHDFLTRHDPKHVVLERREADAERKAEGRRRMAKRRQESAGTSARTSERTRDGHQQESAVSSGRPDQTRPDQTHFPLNPPPSGGRKRSREAWEQEILSWARSVGVDGRPDVVLRALQQAIPWRANGDAASEFRRFTRQHFASSLLTEGDDVE